MVKRRPHFPGAKSLKTKSLKWPAARKPSAADVAWLATRDWGGGLGKNTDLKGQPPLFYGYLYGNVWNYDIYRIFSNIHGYSRFTIVYLTELFMDIYMVIYGDSAGSFGTHTHTISLSQLEDSSA